MLSLSLTHIHTIDNCDEVWFILSGYINNQNNLYQSRYFQLTCGVEYYATICLAHIIEGRLTAPYYRNYLEKKLMVNLEDVPLAT
jgi:hypothetical protein